MENIYIRGALFIAGSYLMGAIPFGLIVALLLGKGSDPRKVGSGNIGATNVSRAVGITGGVLTLFLDAAKGFIPLMAARKAFPGDYYLIVTLCGAAAFLGHIFPIYLKFKGGKGVATAFGIVTFMSPITAILLVIIFSATLVLSGYVSLGSMFCAISFPLVMSFLGPSPYYIGLSLFMAIMVIYKHRENINRLVAGSETRFIQKK